MTQAHENPVQHGQDRHRVREFLRHHGLTPGDGELDLLVGVCADAAEQGRSLRGAAPEAAGHAYGRGAPFPEELRCQDAAEGRGSVEGVGLEVSGDPSDVPDSLLASAVALRKGTLSSTELVTELLRRADTCDPRLGSYLSRHDEQALAAARIADRERADGRARGVLHGLPVTVKDLIAAREGPTTGHSAAPPWFQGGTDAECVARLRSAGMIVLGKVSLSEFGFGGADPEAGLPVPANPWDTSRWPGGSSSGSAAGVAAGLTPASVGTDTGGSIRIPSALCGVTGFKPTFGAVPTDGVIPGAPTVDVVGPIARTAADCRVLFDALTGHPGDLDPSTRVGDLRGMRVAVDTSSLGGDGMDPALPDAVEAVAAALADVGAELYRLDTGLPAVAELDAACRVVQTAETFETHRVGLGRHWDAYGSRTRVSLTAGAFHTAQDYLYAQRVRRAGAGRIAEFLREHGCTLVLQPVLGIAAPPLDCDLFGLLPQFFTSVWNATGFPAAALPGPPNSDGLPLGVQVAGLPGDDRTVLRAAQAVQAGTDWHRRRPPQLW